VALVLVLLVGYSPALRTFAVVSNRLNDPPEVVMGKWLEQNMPGRVWTRATVADHWRPSPACTKISL